ncbi:hypothetical protein HPMBJEAJ_00185 [Aeromonas phage avDM6]|nr:hypothetical protein HPMBJEAJ_00185 [Aeromonas phage avDM6]
MGSFNTICSVSRQIVECGDKVVLLAMANGACISAIPLNAVYDDYGDFEVTKDLGYDCLFKNVSMHNEGVTHNNLMNGLGHNSDNKWSVPNLFSTTKDTRSEITLSVIKSSVYDLVAEYGSKKWNYKKEYNLDLSSRWEDRTPESTARNIERLELQIEEYKKSDEEDFLINHMYTMIDNLKMGNVRHHELYSLSQYGEMIDHYAHHDDSTKAIFDNIDIFSKLEDFFIGISALDITLVPQEYGRQTVNQFERVKMLTDIQIAAFNQTEKIQLTPIEWDVKVPSNIVEEYTKPDWSNEFHLIRYHAGMLEITNSKYNPLKEYKHPDVFLSEDMI